MPNDPSFTASGGFTTPGSSAASPAPTSTRRGAWDVTTGGDVTVAIIDTGIDYRHPDLDDNIWTNPATRRTASTTTATVSSTTCAASTSPTTTPTPTTTRATAPTSPASSAPRATTRSAWSACNWKVRLMALKFLDANGEGNTADAAEAIDYAVGPAHGSINASWGGPAFSQTLYKASRERGQQRRPGRRRGRQRGRELATSSPDYPAALRPPQRHLGRRDRPPDDGCSTSRTTGRSTVDLAAPGDEIYSTVPRSDERQRVRHLQRHVDGGAVRQRCGRALPVAVTRPRTVAAGARRAAAVGRPAAVARGQDRHRRQAQRGQDVRRRSSPAGRARRAAAGDTTAPSPFRLHQPAQPLRAPQAAALRFRWQRSHDIERHPLLQALRRRQEAQDRARPGRAGRARALAPTRLVQARRRPAPLVRARLRLRGQQPQEQNVAARKAAASVLFIGHASLASSGFSPRARDVERHRLGEALQLHLADRLEARA